MEKLRAYLNSLSQEDQIEFATRCKTSIGYLRKGMSVGQLFGESICINIERESRGAVTCEDIRPDVDWAYLRGTDKPLTEDKPSSPVKEITCGSSDPRHSDRRNQKDRRDEGSA